MKILRILLGCVLLTVLVSCTRVYVPFTLELRNEYQLTDQEVRELQFYVSDRVILEREIVDIDKRVSKEHILKKIEDKILDQVVFRSFTPGVAVDVLPYALQVAFEQQGYLTFETDGELEDPYYFKSDRYGEEVKLKIFDHCWWFKHYEDEIYSNGLVDYNGHEYWVYHPENRPHLLVDEESLEKIIENRRIVKGIRQKK